jgi:hypothetical protein
MTSKPTRRIGKLELVVRAPAELDPTERKIMGRAAHACPVEKSLSEAVEVAVKFVWGDGDGAASPRVRGAGTAFRGSDEAG